MAEEFSYQDEIDKLSKLDKAAYEQGMIDILLKGNYISDIFTTDDNRLILTANRNDLGKIREFDTGRLVQSYTGHTGLVWCIRPSADLTSIFTSSKDATLRQWDLKSGEMLEVFEGHTDWIRSFCVHPQKKQLISGSDDKNIIIWDSDSGEILRRWRAHDNGIAHIFLSEDTKAIVSVSFAGEFAVWDIDTGKNISTTQTGCAPSRTSIITCSHQYLAIYDEKQNIIYIYDWNIGKPLHTIKTNELLTCVVFDHSGNHIMGIEKNINLWDLSTQKLIYSTSTQARFGPESACFSANDRYILTGGSVTNNAIRIFDSYTGKLERLIPNENEPIRHIDSHMSYNLAVEPPPGLESLKKIYVNRSEK